MKPIVTVTLNPSIDGSCEADRVLPTSKVRTTNASYDPGGGGVNVARVVLEMGGPALPVYFAGGATGGLFGELLEAHGVSERVAIDIDDHTRISTTVFDRATRQEYRFVPEGPAVTETEWRRCLERLEAIDYDWIVVSGSAPRGFPEGCYGALAAQAAARKARFVLDSSGRALAAGIRGGGIYLAKPSIGEFRALTGRALETDEEIEEEGRALISSGKMRMVAITMGDEGAMLITERETFRASPPPVEAHSAVGAGDSFLGAMVHALARGDSVREAFLIGVAAGTAAVTTPGTALCRREDVLRLREMLE